MRAFLPPIPVPVATTREVTDGDTVRLHRHPKWSRSMPWLVQGITDRGVTGDFDLGLFGTVPVGESLRRWRSLREVLGFERVVHARQVHGASVVVHRRGAAGLLIGDGVDGHATLEPGLLVTVSVADCVPVYLADPARRAVALLHAGWRGIAAGVLEQGVRTLSHLVESAVETLHLHLGPAICGRCYEVGPEVHQALGLDLPDGPQPVDLRAVLVARAIAAGIATEHLTVSAFCTRCDGGTFFSHRGGDAGRQMAFLGIHAAR